jgi:NADPH:quinone reductase
VHSWLPRPEQGVGGLHVGLGLVAVGGNPGDFGLKLGDAHVEFSSRIGIERFAAEQAGGIATGSRAVVVIHRQAASDARCLLSTGQEARSLNPWPSCNSGAAKGADMTASLPESMVAIGFDAPGGPEVLRPQALPVPRPGSGEVLIQVAYAGVNRPDVAQRLGSYPPPAGASPIPGLEVAGTIVAVGGGAAGQVLGQQVCALVTGGGYAEYCLADARHCLPVPEGLSLAEAAALPETLFTVWHNVFERGWARDGETILVHGGTSGIGTMAISLGRLFGLKVIVTCGGEAKCLRAVEIGAAHAIDYKARDFVAEVVRITDGRGVNLVLDMVSGDYVPRNLKCLAEDGRHVTIAILGGAGAELNMAVVMSRRYTLTGSTLRPRSAEFKALLAQEIAANAWPFVESGQLRPVMDQTFPLAEAAAAHARMEAGDHIGKIVLEVV